MRTGVCLLVILLISMSLPATSTADNGYQIPTNDIRIDEHWMDIFQSDDRSELEVIEYIFYNNTGNDIFNGSLYSWIPDGALIRSTCCGNAPDMGCRLLEGGQMLCFDFHYYNSNIVYGVPYDSYSFLSYFGQTEQLSIVANSQNFTFSDTLFMNFTIGQGQVDGDFPAVTGQGVHVTTNTEQFGAVAQIPIGGGMAEKLGVLLTLKITNLMPDNDTVELDLLGLPDGWSGVFIHDGAVLRNVSVPVNESEEILLHMQVPSYILEVQLDYFIPLEGKDDAEAQYFYEKEILYEHDFLEVFAFLLEDDDLTVNENLFELASAQWNNDYRRMWHSYGVVGLGPGERISLTIEWENKVDYSQYLLVAVIAILIVVIGFLFARRRRSAGPEKGVESKPMVEETEEVIPDNLEEKKRKILLAIKRLEKDHKDGIIPDDVYDELSAQYKKSAIAVMKEMEKKG